MKNTNLLTGMAFYHLFPYCGDYKKDISKNKAIYIDTMYKNNGFHKIEDDDGQLVMFYFKVCIIDVTNKNPITHKIFKNVENLIKYLKTIES